jgi:hypothetical protein
MKRNRWTSRKFLLSLVAQLAALSVLFWPEHESTIVEASRSIGALLVTLLSARGYLQAEASVDRRQLDNERVADPSAAP